MFKDIHEFTKLIDRIDYCVQLYENKYMSDNDFELYLSNGDRIRIFYSQNSLPHLLGININFLRSTGLYDDSAWNILLDILENPNKLYSQIKNGHINPEQVFSKFINKKLENFENICGINVNKIEFISKYEKEKTYGISDTSLDGQYYIGFRSNYDTLSVIGFTRDADLYNPITNLSFHYHYEKDEFLKKLLNNQTLLSLDFLIKNKFINGRVEKHRLFHPHEDKLKKLKLLDSYAKEYNAVCDTRKDSIHYVENCINLIDKINRICEMFERITLDFELKQTINIPKLIKKYGELPESLETAFSTYNDSLSNNQNKGTTNAYGELLEELKSAKEQAEKSAKLVATLNKKCATLEVENKVLTDENKSLNEGYETIRKVVSIK